MVDEDTACAQDAACASDCVALYRRGRRRHFAEDPVVQLAGPLLPLISHKDNDYGASIVWVWGITIIVRIVRLCVTFASNVPNCEFDVQSRAHDFASFASPLSREVFWCTLFALVP